MEEASRAILQILLKNFTDSNRSAEDLSQEYEGVNLDNLKVTICDGAAISSVDFDLALKDLEEGELVSTGPLTAFSQPGLIGILSKREFVYLTEKGFKAARKAGAVEPKRGKRRGRL